jgi:hypothetical protein
MTRKFTRNASALRGIAPFIAVLTVMIALAALAQTKGTSEESGKLNRNSVRAPIASSQRNKFKAGTNSSGEPLFLPPVTYDSGGLSADSVAVSDVNNDGFPDIVVANNCADSTCAEGSVGVLLGNGDGTFQPAVTYGSGGKSAKSVAIADLNGDGKPDLVVANCGLSNRCPPDGGVGTVGVLLGNGDGTFQTAVAYLSGGIDPMSIAVADVNNDGKPDLLVGHLLGNGDSTLSVLLGNGDGTFHAAVSYDSGGVGLEGIAVADVNHDGKLDLVAAESVVINGSTGAGVAVLLGNGDGTFQPAKGYFSGACGPLAVAVADVNGDGKLDIMIGLASLSSWPTGCSGDHGAVAVLLGNGDGTFQQPTTWYDTGGQVESSIAVGDVNGDGHNDLAVANWEHVGLGDVGLGVLLGNGDGTFQSVINFSSGPNDAKSVALVDVNGDHRPDLVVANPCCTGSAGDGVIGVLLNNTGPHTATTTELISSLNPAPPNHVVTYTATVIPQSGTATGTVMFQDGGTTIATVTLTGNEAAYTTSYKKTALGVHLITATYSGDLHNAHSTSSTLTEDIQGASKTVVVSSGSPSLVGQSVTFTATVTSVFGNIPDGEMVTFYDGPTAMGSVALAGGTAAYTTASLSAKTHTIKATYAGDAMFKTSTGFVTQVVNKYTTTTTLTSSPNPSHSGQAVTFTAKVTSTGPAPTGKVKFLDGTLAIGTATLSGGAAKLTKSTLAVGTHPITAQYLGNTVSSTSTSSVVNQVVQ